MSPSLTSRFLLRSMGSLILCTLIAWAAEEKPWLARVSSRTSSRHVPRSLLETQSSAPGLQQEPQGLQVPGEHLRGCGAHPHRGETLEAVPSALQAGHHGLCLP